MTMPRGSERHTTQRLAVEIDARLFAQVNRVRGARRLSKFVEDALRAEVARAQDERARSIERAAVAHPRSTASPGDRPSTTEQAQFTKEARERIGRVFAAHAALPDHRRSSPWLDAFLGNPFAPVWFIGENPSLGQVERASASAVLRDTESQWAVSKGDKVFREMLFKHGFKTGGEMTRGGWNCYLTNVIKSAHPAEAWRKLPKAHRLRIAEQWAPVLAWELQTGAPNVLVSLGDKVDELLDYLVKRGLLPDLPVRRKIDHYSYVASRPESRRGPTYRLGGGHPKRVEAYSDQFAAIAREAEQIR